MQKRLPDQNKVTTTAWTGNMPSVRQGGPCQYATGEQTRQALGQCTPALARSQTGQGRMTPEHARLRNQSLCCFLARVQSEPAINLLLTHSGTNRNGEQERYDQLLQRAAARASSRCEFGRAQCEVLYVATQIAGIGRLLAPTVVDGSWLDDVLHTQVRDALRLLDEEAPTRASLLRQCLGWGNLDEIDEQRIADLRRAIDGALDHTLAKNSRKTD